MKQQEEPEGHCGGRKRAGASVLGHQLVVPKTDHFPVVIVKQTDTAVEEQKSHLIHFKPDKWSTWSVTDAENVVFLVLCQEQARKDEIAGRKSTSVSMEHRGIVGPCREESSVVNRSRSDLLHSTNMRGGGKGKKSGASS